MGDLFPDQPIDLRQQINCVEREIGKRKSVYPRLINAGRMTQETADYETRAMKAVLETLKGIR